MEGEDKQKRVEKADMLSLASPGFFFILVGATWMANPNLTDETVNFFKDFQLVKITEHIVFPAPAKSHPVVCRRHAVWPSLRRLPNNHTGSSIRFPRLFEKEG